MKEYQHAAEAETTQETTQETQLLRGNIIIVIGEVNRLLVCRSD
jgi:hypothetical protein